MSSCRSASVSVSVGKTSPSSSASRRIDSKFTAAPFSLLATTTARAAFACEESYALALMGVHPYWPPEKWAQRRADAAKDEDIRVGVTRDLAECCDECRALLRRQLQTEE